VDHALGITPWPAWVAVATIVIGPASALLTRVMLHRPATATKGTRYAQAAE
jgi:putative oxidoreductase